MVKNPFVFESPLRKVYFADTDAAGVVHHSNYVRWFEAGRIDFLEAIGLPYEELQSQKIGFVPISLNIKYHAPLRFGDAYTIQTALTELKKVRFLIQAEIFSKDKQRCASCEVWLACMNEANWKVQEIPKELYTALRRKQ